MNTKANKCVEKKISTHIYNSSSSSILSTNTQRFLKQAHITRTKRNRTAKKCQRQWGKSLAVGINKLIWIENEQVKKRETVGKIFWNKKHRIKFSPSPNICNSSTQTILLKKKSKFLWVDIFFFKLFKLILRIEKNRLRFYAVDSILLMLAAVAVGKRKRNFFAVSKKWISVAISSELQSQCENCLIEKYYKRKKVSASELLSYYIYFLVNLQLIQSEKIWQISWWMWKMVQQVRQAI